MLSTKEAAQQLKVSEQRVRKMLADGQLQGEKLGRSWMVSEESVQQRKLHGAHPGRPKETTSSAAPSPIDAEEAHRIFDDAKRVLSGCYSAPFLGLARSPEEKEFWIRTANLFLQQKQRELIAQGVY
ncbi:MAG: helix-turn-helix domain-containing protein [Eggerthellaceae bacterium]|nr:helix-turn-helix domain-containing protein [Eggerthellaceae bacterium]